MPDAFPSNCRYDYVISNSSCCVHYEALTKDTEPSEAEVANPANIARLISEIGGCSTVLTMGKRAGLALDHAVRCGYGGRVIRCDWHLSFSRINSSISIDITGRPILKGQSDATLKRIEVVAKDILTKFAA